MGTKAGASYYKVAAISTTYNLMISGVLTSPEEQKSPIIALEKKFPSEVAKLLRIPQQDFTKSPNSAWSFPYPTKFISQTTEMYLPAFNFNIFEDLHSSSPAIIRDLFSLIQQTLQ